MTDPFTTSAEYYEALTNSEKRLQREGPLLLECLRQASGPRIVDLACGTGLHALFFAQHGAEVTAVDVSQQMIEHARRRRSHLHIDYRVRDMRTLDGGPWDLALCLGNSLSLLTNEADLDAMFREVCAHLSSGGVFLAQTLNYEAAVAQQPRHRIERVQSGETLIIAVKDLVPHGQNTLLGLHFFALEEGRVKSVSESAILRNWTRADLVASAEKTGLRVEKILGGFDGAAYDSGASPDLICVMSKPGTGC